MASDSSSLHNAASANHLSSHQGSKRKLSLVSSCDDDSYSPGVEEYIGGSVDDESSIQNEEDEEDEEEIGDLKKEGDMPLEDLIVQYGLNNREYVDLKEESQESASGSESGETINRMSMYDKDDWKKEIMVGPEFQAEIPEMHEKADQCPAEEDVGDTLLWEPDRIESAKLNQYLYQVYSKEDLPVTDSNRDNEEALYLLHSNGYKVESALEGAYKHMAHISSLGAVSSDVHPLSMRPWTEEECQGFENGLKIYEKQFHLIQKNVIPSRTVNEIIQFYYLWKKTERYDIFIQYSRLGSKRYIFNPGQPLDMNRSAPLVSNNVEEQTLTLRHKFDISTATPEPSDVNGDSETP